MLVELSNFRPTTFELPNDYNSTDTILIPPSDIREFKTVIRTVFVFYDTYDANMGRDDILLGKENIRLQLLVFLKGLCKCDKEASAADVLGRTVENISGFSFQSNRHLELSAKERTTVAMQRAGGKPQNEHIGALFLGTYEARENGRAPLFPLDEESDFLFRFERIGRHSIVTRNAEVMVADVDNFSACVEMPACRICLYADPKAFLQLE